MIIVVDANIFIHILLNGAEKGILIRQTRKHTITAPDVLPFEIGNALINLHRKQKLNTQQLIAAFRQFKNIPVRLEPVGLTSHGSIFALFPRCCVAKILT